MRLRDAVRDALRRNVWAREWWADGMLVVGARGGRVFEARTLDAEAPPRLDALGSSGWRKDGTIAFVNLDIDVAHGVGSFVFFVDALAEAEKVRAFVKGAAEVRRSRSGKGLHARIRLGEGVTGGRQVAPLIAKWIARQVGVVTDRAVLGRQCLFWWAAQPGVRGFELVEPCVGTWTPPAEALVAPPLPTVVTAHANREQRHPNRANAPTTVGDADTVTKHATGALPVAVSDSSLASAPFLPEGTSRRTVDFIRDGAAPGQRNIALFRAAADLCGLGHDLGSALRLLLPASLRSGTPEREAEATIRSAYSKPRLPARAWRSARGRAGPAQAGAGETTGADEGGAA